MITIENLDVTKPMMYLWLKKVNGVNLKQHCAKCLLGDYNSNINKHTKHLENLNLTNGIWYLCGVSLPYNWNNNFHLAFEYSENSNIEYSNNGVSVIIKNAKRLPISEKYIDVNDPNFNKKEFFTCRNWQFAHYLKSNKF